MTEKTPTSALKQPGEISKWLQDWPRNGAAFEALWKHFFPKLVGVADKPMRELPSRARDGEDVALSAMNALFQACSDGRYDIRSSDELWRLLLTITIRKVGEERRRQFAQKRGGGIVHIGNHHGDDQGDPIDALVDSGQMPELVEDVYKQCNELLTGLPDEALRVTAEMKLEGCSNEEISDLLHCTVDQTKERLRKIRHLWARHLPSPKKSD